MKTIYFLIALILVGCGEVMTTYTLSPKIYQKVSYSKYKNKTLRVDYPKGIEDTMGSKIYYQDSNLQESYYLYSQWSKSLNRILMSVLVDTLQNSGIFKRVVDYSSTAEVNYILETSIYKFEHKITQNGSFADIEIEVRLLNSINNKVIKSKLFKYKTPCTSTDAKGFVEAANETMEIFGKDLILFLRR